MESGIASLVTDGFSLGALGTLFLGVVTLFVGMAIRDYILGLLAFRSLKEDGFLINGTVQVIDTNSGPVEMSVTRITRTHVISENADGSVRRRDSIRALQNGSIVKKVSTAS